MFNGIKVAQVPSNFDNLVPLTLFFGKLMHTLSKNLQFSIYIIK